MSPAGLRRRSFPHQGAPNQGRGGSRAGVDGKYRDCSAQAVGADGPRRICQHAVKADGLGELHPQELIARRAAGQQRAATKIGRGQHPVANDHILEQIGLGPNGADGTCGDSAGIELLDLVGQQLTKAIGHMDEVHRSGPRSRCAGNDAPAAGQGKGRQAEPSGTVP